MVGKPAAVWSFDQYIQWAQVGLIKCDVIDSKFLVQRCPGWMLAHGWPFMQCLFWFLAPFSNNGLAPAAIHTNLLNCEHRRLWAWKLSLLQLPYKKRGDKFWGYYVHANHNLSTDYVALRDCDLCLHTRTSWNSSSLPQQHDDHWEKPTLAA